MIRHKVLLFILLIIMTFIPEAQAEEISKKPDWLDGKLYMTVLGGPINANSYSEHDRYVVCFDFDEGKIKLEKVPYNAYLVENRISGGGFFVAYPPIRSEFGYDFGGGPSPYKWREGVDIIGVFQDSCISQADKAKINEHDGNRDSAKIYECYTLHDCLHLLAVDPIQPFTANAFYYMRFGASENGELEAQFVGSHLASTGSWAENEPNIIYARYPIDENLQNWRCSISTDGKPAWTDKDYSVHYYDGEDVVLAIPGRLNDPLDDNYVSDVCWADDQTLLFFCKHLNDNDYNEYRLVAWDIEEKRGRLITDKDGDPLVIADGKDYTAVMLALSGNGRLLAVLAEIGNFETGWDSDTFPRFDIIVFNLQSGERFEFWPWPILHTGSERYHYFETSFGIIIDQPIETCDTQMIWGPVTP